MKRLKVLVGVLMLVIVIAVTHTAAHFYLWGTGIPGFAESGISGLSVGKFSIGEDATGVYSIDSSISQIFVIVEWLAVFAFMITVFTKSRAAFRQEVGELQSALHGVRNDRETELDTLHRLLQKRKKISFGPIAKIFAVDRSIVQEWAQTLASGKLARIHYPRMGDPELVLVTASS